MLSVPDIVVPWSLWWCMRIVAFEFIVPFVI
jgi:hypothetical protein